MHLKPLSKCLKSYIVNVDAYHQTEKAHMASVGETFDLDEEINVSIQHRLDLSFIYLTIQRVIK